MQRSETAAPALSVDPDAVRDFQAYCARRRLEKAAPDLLEALIMVRDADEDCKSDGLPTIPPAARAKIDEAIAKAEGRS